MEEFDEEEMFNSQKEPRRKVRLVKNGDPSVMRTCLIKDHINFDGLAEVVCEAIEVSRRDIGQVRIFKTGGVEVFNEDVQYIKDGDILFVSFGDEFDESSNFALYKLLNCLGQGGYGKVFEARNRLNKERYAIKMIDCSKIKNAKDTEMIYKELIALKNLSHRSILKVYNCFTLQKEMKVALVLEYLEGGDLRDYLNEKKVLGEKEAQKLFTQLFHAIQYCHKESIIHRDLKLENIMFDDKEHERLKVVDFGISGRQSLVNIDYTEAGSIRYLAPEVITSHAPAHPSIDVWAMGCILFWMLTGNSPFPQSTREAVQESIVKGKWGFSAEDKKNLTKASQDFIKMILVVNPKDRATLGELAEHRWMNMFYDDIVSLEEKEKEQASSLKSKKITQSSNSTEYSIEVSPATAPPLKQKTLPSSMGTHKTSSPMFSSQHNKNSTSNNLTQPQRKPQIPSFEFLSPSNHSGNRSSFTKPSPLNTQNHDSNRLTIPQKGDPHRRFSYQPMQSAVFGIGSNNSIQNESNLDKEKKQSMNNKTKSHMSAARSKSPGTSVRQKLATLNPPSQSSHLHAASHERRPSTKSHNDHAIKKSMDDAN